MKSVWVIGLMIISSIGAINAQKSNVSNKPETVYIQTSAVCGMCKTTIENALYKVKGVISADLDVATRKVMVTYKPSKTGIDALRQAISLAGYDADDVKADSLAYENLHGCCKKE